MASIHPIYSYIDYRKYLDWVLSADQMGRGARQRLADYLGCQPSFISQVLNGRNELSDEYAFKMNGFLNHDGAEQDFFMNLVHLSKAGTEPLRQYYSTVLEKIKSKQLQVEAVVTTDRLSEADTMEYYSDWLHVCLHMLVSIKEFQNVESMRKRLAVDKKEFDRALAFLKRTGLVHQEKQVLKTGKAHIHMKKESMGAHAASVMMRLKTLDKLDLKNPHSLNYSLSFTVSQKGYEELKKRILDLIGSLDGVLNEGEPTKFCCLVTDLVEF